MSNRGILRVVLAALLAFGSGPAIARAADGDLDPTFGAGGKVVTTFDLPAMGANAVALQADGKIVAAGFTFDETANIDFGIARYQTDGTLDATFDFDGRARVDFFGLFDTANAVAIQPDGKIVVAGSAANSLGSDFALVRYNSDGSLDNSFDGDGKATTDFSGGGDIAYGVAIQPDGKIVAAGVTNQLATSADVALARYNADGSLDMSFGTGGRVQTDVFGEGEVAFALALQPDGKILVAGLLTRTNSPTADDSLLIRYGPSGVPDPAFGSGGVVITDFRERGNGAGALTLQPDGKIVVAGGAADPLAPGQNFAIARYRSNGTLDPDFDGDGRKTTDLPGFDESVRAVAVQSDGKIVAAGFAANPDFTLDFALVRYLPDGTEDSLFGMLGRVTTDFSERTDVAAGIALQPDGKIVVAGSAQVVGFNPWFALARYLGSTAGATCPRSTGFWKSHPDAWPVSSLILGVQTYTDTELRALLSSPVKGDASLLLAAELIAAKLNVASGVSFSDLASAIGEADALLGTFAGKLPYRVSPSTEQGRAMIRAAGKLGRLNNRRSAPGCGRPE
ncbi:MAG TPA: delta-60 repeat domain-containing protein [Thermoanaerobaculia bacterium]|nr:delta-60 repeat domain-containing protein [Thermoanaerobaculia bacterium]